MKDLELRLAEDKALRDAAKAVVQADVTFLKEDFTPGALKHRMADGASEIFDHAKDVADDNKGILGTLLAAIVIWFARNPVLSLLDPQDEPDIAAEQDGDHDRSEQEH